MWTHKNTFAIGGLENVGFADNGDFLLVLSSQGMGIFNCLTGEKLGRKYDAWWPEFNQEDFSIKGFYSLSDSVIKTCGMYGENILSRKTPDDCIVAAEKFLNDRIFLYPSDDEKICLFIPEHDACELRAFGFSETGKSLIVATSCELVIWSRE
jgi:hypothetical protein